MAPLGIGIVGFGGFGQFLYRSWSPLHSVEVRAVADSMPHLREVVDRVGSDAGQERPRGPSVAHRDQVAVYSDWADVLGDPRIDIVAIATPPHLHAEMACAALEAGKHILVEKPLAITREDALRVVEARDTSGCVAAVDYMLRFNPIVEVVGGWARRRPFGRLRRVLVENYAQDEDLHGDHWFWNVDLSGGILVEHAVHFIDLVHSCTDAGPDWIDGLALRRDDGIIDRMGMTVVYADDVVVQQHHEFSRPGCFEDTNLRFVFDLAQVDVAGWIPLSGRITALVSNESDRYFRQLPGLSIDERVPVSEAPNVGRPKARGDAHTSSGRLRSGGHPYEVEWLVRGQFGLAESKQESYAMALRGVMGDLVDAIHDPAHRLRTGLEEGLLSLEVALEATRRGLEQLDNR